MKVQRGLTITDLPGIKSITVQHDAAYPTAVITPEYSTEYPWQFGLQALTTLRDALDLCITEMRRDAVTKPTTSQGVFIEPRVFTAGDAEPAGDVTVVLDKDGDRWERVDGGWVNEPGDSPSSWKYVVAMFGPLIEVLKTEASE